MKYITLKPDLVMSKCLLLYDDFYCLYYYYLFFLTVLIGKFW
jgi:hypothetical protein